VDSKIRGLNRLEAFYINYHSYRYVWPLLALSHYLKR
jgi:squalene cyclase